MKKTIIILIVLVLVGFGFYYFAKKSTKQGAQNNQPTTENVETQEPAPIVEENKPESVIGKSVENRDITAYHFGQGEKELLLIAGVHGGYAWNTALLGYEIVDYLKANPTAVPSNVKVTVVPVLNPDGLNKTVGSAGRFVLADVPTAPNSTVSGRFNANEVDLNRNFDCEWQASGKWQNKTVSGGTAPFSEPESMAVKSYVEANTPAGVVVYYSAAGGVFASSCNNGVSTATKDLMNKYAVASKYPAQVDFDFYNITGDMINWLAKNNIPAISVLLTNHTSTEWAKNWAGIEALIAHIAQ
jgi:uncharacterized protein YxeA